MRDGTEQRMQGHRQAASRVADEGGEAAVAVGEQQRGADAEHGVVGARPIEVDEEGVDGPNAVEDGLERLAPSVLQVALDGQGQAGRRREGEESGGGR